MPNLLIAIESSCDDSCISVVSSKFEIIYEKSISQIDLHKAYGGVFPELASRSHLEYLQIILADLRNYVDILDVKAVAATYAPGLIGGLLVGCGIAKGICHMYDKKIIPVHHLEGHLESVNIEKEKHVDYPNLTLLVSGGHCQFILAKSFGNYEVLGKTLDDSVGEAFDKIGKMLGFEYPGGPKIEEFAKNGNDYIEIGKPMIDNGLNFSFSGFKTSVMRFLEKHKEDINPDFIASVCKNAQDRISENLVYKSTLAIEYVQKMGIDLQNFVLCGGVAANKTIIANIQSLCNEKNIRLYHPQLKYATDNATMIAFAGVKRMNLDLFGDLAFSPVSRIPISEVNIR